MSTPFPMFLKLEGKRCLVVGAGRIGEPKIASLLDTGARVHVIALEANPAVQGWAQAGKITLDLGAYTEKNLEGTFLAVVATASRPLNAEIYRQAQRRGVLCNVVDDPAYCDFYYGALVRRGDLQIAISTNGQSPSLAQKIRQQLERQFGPRYRQWVAELGETRKLVNASDLDPHRKRELLLSLANREALHAALREKKPRSDESAGDEPVRQEPAIDETRITA